MGGDFFKIIRQVAMFMICAQMLMHFKPAESYGKYIRLLVSMMVLAQLIVPLLGFFGKGGDAVFQESLGYYEGAFAEGLAEVNAACERAEKLLEQMTLEEVKSRINQETVQENDEYSTPGEDAAISGEIVIDRIEVEIHAGEGEAVAEE